MRNPREEIYSKIAFTSETYFLEFSSAETIAAKLYVSKNSCNRITNSGTKLYKLRSEKLIKLPGPKKEPMRIVGCFRRTSLFAVYLNCLSREWLVIY